VGRGNDVAVVVGVDVVAVVGCVVVEDGAGDVVVVVVVTGSDVVTSVASVDVMSVEGVVSLVDTIASSPLQPSVIESANETAIRAGRMYTRLTSRASIIRLLDRLRQGPTTCLAMLSVVTSRPGPGPGPGFPDLGVERTVPIPTTAQLLTDLENEVLHFVMCCRRRSSQYSRIGTYGDVAVSETLRPSEFLLYGAIGRRSLNEMGTVSSSRATTPHDMPSMTLGPGRSSVIAGSPPTCTDGAALVEAQYGEPSGAYTTTM
jgi:hypothetical protein